MKRILQITTYDIEVPDHGGKLRSHHIRKALRAEYDVQTLSIEWGDNECLLGLAVTLDNARLTEFKLNGWLVDLGLLTYLDATPILFAQICDAVHKFNPDIILVEQPYPWPLVEKLLANGTLRAGTRTIYSSHNVEIDMKRKSYADLFTPEEAEIHSDTVMQIEQNAILECAAMLCTTELDYAFAGKLRAEVPRQVFCNGHSHATHNFEALAKWQDNFTSAALNFAFVGSAHPPNINGIWDLLQALPKSFLAKNTNIWILGGVGPALIDMKAFDPNEYPFVQITGRVDAEDIDAALALSDGVLLPIWEGSGSNLKTAQALLTDRPVIASKFSFRGFENYLSTPGVLISESTSGLANLLANATPASPIERSDCVESLTWEKTLEDLAQFVRSHFDMVQEKPS